MDSLLLILSMLKIFFFLILHLSFLKNNPGYHDLQKEFFFFEIMFQKLITWPKCDMECNLTNVRITN